MKVKRFLLTAAAALILSALLGVSMEEIISVETAAEKCG